MRIMEKNLEDNGEIVVLTGAAGCIGFHTLSLLIERDERVREVRCLDLRDPCAELKGQIDTLLREYNGKKKSGHKKVINWFRGDIRDLNLIEKLLYEADCVIHGAAKIEAWTHWVDQDVEELRSVNVGGTENLLKACQRLAVPKFIHVSSFETYIGYDTIYYATENTLPESKNFLFGASGSTKWDAENIVRNYANNKLNCPKSRSKKPEQHHENNDQLLAVIIRFSTVYGEFDGHYVSKILEMTKFFNGKLQRMSNVWIKQQSIYARNAAWSLVKAKQQLDRDKSISGEEFHITDDTEIVDPFDFVAPFIESQGMQVTHDSYSFIPAWLLLWLTFTLVVFMRKFDFLGLVMSTKGRYEAAVEKDKNQRQQQQEQQMVCKKNRWYHYVMPQTLWFMCNSSFLNRTKASLRLDYEPIVTPEESLERSLNWYKKLVL